MLTIKSYSGTRGRNSGTSTISYPEGWPKNKNVRALISEFHMNDLSLEPITELNEPINERHPTSGEPMQSRKIAHRG
jgi:hypothetical protein